MKQRYLEVTSRKGKPLAAYLYLPRPTRSRAARTIDAGLGVHVDFDERGVVIGVEISAPSALSVADLNGLLVKHGILERDAAEYAPLAA